eukprot:581338-Hanusia_phi.AAC.12
MRNFRRDLNFFLSTLQNLSRKFAEKIAWNNGIELMVNAISSRTSLLNEHPMQADVCLLLLRCLKEILLALTLNKDAFDSYTKGGSKTLRKFVVKSRCLNMLHSVLESSKNNLIVLEVLHIANIFTPASELLSIEEDDHIPKFEARVKAKERFSLRVKVFLSCLQFVKSHLPQIRNDLESNCLQSAFTVMHTIISTEQNILQEVEESRMAQVETLDRFTCQLELVQPGNFQLLMQVFQCMQMVLDGKHRCNQNLEACKNVRNVTVKALALLMLSFETSDQMMTEAAKLSKSTLTPMIGHFLHDSDPHICLYAVGVLKAMIDEPLFLQVVLAHWQADTGICQGLHKLLPPAAGLQLRGMWAIELLGILSLKCKEAPGLYDPLGDGTLR